MKAIKNKEKAKIKTKQDKNCKTSQINSIKRLVLGNSQIISFKDVLSNSLVGLSSDAIQSPTPIQPMIATEQSVDSILFVNH